MKGYLVWWAVPDDVQVAFEKLKHLGATPPTPLQAWQKGTTLAALAVREDFEGYRITLRKVTKNKKQILAEVIRDVPIKEKRVITIPLIAAEFTPPHGDTYEVFSTAPGDIRCEDIIEKIKRCFQDALEYADAQDLRRHIRKMLLESLLGAPVRKTGGLYFVPANVRFVAVQDVLLNIRQALKSSDERIEFSFVRILDDEEAAMIDIKESIFEFLVNELNDLKASSENLKFPNVRGENKKSALHAALEKYKTLASRVEVYKETFESNFEVIALALERIYQDLLDALDTLPVSTPQPQDTLFAL